MALTTRYDLNIYGLSLDKVTGVQFMPYGPQFAVGRNVVIEFINGEPNIDGTLPFIIPYQQSEGVVTYFDVFGQNFDYVYGMQFVPYGPISGPPSPTPTGPPEPPTPLTVGEFQYWDPTHIGISQYDMPWYLDNGVFQRSTWYKLLLHCHEASIPVDPTLAPTGPPVPAVPLVPPDFALVTNQHIGIPFTTQQRLLGDSTLNYVSWYKFYLTYDCGTPPPPIPTARAINPSQGWNWDPAYVIAPDIIVSRVVDEFTGPLLGWLPYGSAVASPEGLILSAGPALNSFSGVDYATPYMRGDWTIDFNIDRPSSSDILPDLFTYVALDYWFVNEGWEVAIAREYRPDVGHAYTAYIWSPDGETTGFISTNSWRGSLRIIRFKNSITMLARDFGAERWQTVAYTRVAPIGDEGGISIYNSNGNVAQIVTATVERYIMSPGVMFGLEPAVYAEIAPDNINLKVQPQLNDTTRFVDIAVYTPTLLLRETINGFEYVRPNRFNLGGQPALDWWIYRDVPTQPGIEHTGTLPDPGSRIMNLTLSPTFGHYNIGQIIQYKVLAKFNDGSKRDITAMCVWTTTDVDGTITQGGLMYFGTAPGIYFVSATYQGLTQTAAASLTCMERSAQKATLDTHMMARYSQMAILV